MSTLKKAVHSLINRILIGFRVTAAAVATLGLAVGTIPLTANAADVYWDPDLTAAGNNVDGTGLGGDGTWDTTALQWWDGVGTNSAWNNLGGDIGIFSYPLPLPSAQPSFFSVSLGTPISAGGLSFMQSGYTLSGDVLTLTGDATLKGSYGTETTISSQISGTDGLTVTGGGTFILTNSANDFTGGISIDNGTVVVTDIGALGGDTGLIDINGTSTRSIGAGSLVVDATAGPIDISREIDIQGRGPISDRGTTLMTYGDVTLSSTTALETQKGFTNTRTTAVTGTLAITSDINNSGGQHNTYASFGGINDVSIGNYSITGSITGDGSLEKSGSGRLLLDPSDTSGFNGTIRISGSSFDEGGIRIVNDGVIGTRTGTGSVSASNGAVLDLNNGMLEVRMDAPSVTAGGGPANVYQRVNGTISVDNAADDTGIVLGGTLVLGDYRTDDDRNMILEGRNGFNLTIGNYTEIGGGGDQTDIFNRLEGGGLFTIDGDANFQNGATSTEFRFLDSGDSLITGSLTPSNAGVTHTLRKDGLGTLTIEGTDSVNMDVLNIIRGTVAITDFRSLGGVTSILIDGNASQGSNGLSTLEIGTSQTPGSAADLTTAAAISLTGANNQDARLLANQTGSVGVTFSGDITSTVDGNLRDLILGGTNTADNTISGNIVQGDPTDDIRIWKVGSGTWVLSGAGNAYENQTLIQNGTLKAQANAITSTIIPNLSDIRFVQIGNVPGPGTSLNDISSQRGGGTFEFVGNASENNIETARDLIANDGSNTVRLTPGASGTASLIFRDLSLPNNRATINLDGLTGGNTISFSGYTGSTTDIADAGVYVNGTDFALIDFDGAATAVRAPVYGTDAGFVNSIDLATFTAGTHNNVTADITTTGTLAIRSLRIDGSTTNTLTLGGQLAIGTGGGVNDDGGIILTGGDATITGSAIEAGNGPTSTGDVHFLVEDGRTLTVASNISTNSDGSFIKAGTGTLIIDGNFQNVGVNAINEGTVILGTGGNLANRAIYIGQDALLDLNGNSESFRNFDINGELTNSSATDITITVGNGNQGGIANGTINETNGTISMVKVGTATQSWDGVSNYTGSTTISSTGAIVAHALANIGSDSSIGRGDNTSDATNAASLIFNGASASGDFGALEYDGWDAVATDRLFTFGGTAADSGAAIESNGVNQANIVFSNTGTLAFGAGTDNVNQTLRLGGTSRGDNVFLPQITDNPNGSGITSVLKNEDGVWTLGGNNTYTGTTTINRGRLIATDGVGIHADSGVLIDNGMWLSSGTITRDLVGTLTGASNEIAFGATGNQTGFGSAEGDLVVTLSGGAPLTWGTDFMPVGNDIRFNNLESYGEVDFTNDINLGATRRNIRVTNNANAAGDFATLSGDLSGSGGILLDGGGTLNLTGDNSYTGTTDLRNISLVVNSLGNSSSGPATSSVGATANANLAANGILLEGGGNNPAQLIYTGTGEVSDRYIELRSNGGNANREPHIYASGTGALILTNVINTSTVANRQLYLRGNNAAGNMITSTISDGAGGNFEIVVDGAATWILSGVNTYTNRTSINAGALGVTNSDSLGTSLLSFNNGVMFAHGNDVTFTNQVEIDNNTGLGFIGEHSLTFTDPTINKNGNNNWSINNSIDNTNGALLTFEGDIDTDAGGSLNQARTFTAGGTGVTSIEGSILNTSGQNINVNRNNGGTLRLGGTASEFNAGVFTIDNGVIQMGADEVIPHGAGEVANILFDPEAGETATLDINGFSETVNRVTTQDAGDSIIDNTGATDGTFTFGADDSVSVFGGNTTITDSGTGTLSLQKTGAGVQTIGTGVGLTYEGTTGVDGGSLTVQADLQSTSGLTVTNGGTLTVEGELQSSETLSVTGTGSVLDIDGAITNAAGITSVTVDNGGTLDLVNANGDKLTGVTTLSLGATGDITLSLEAGDVTGNDQVATDTIGNGTVVASTGANTVTINITDLGINPNGTSVYNLIEANDGLDNATYVLGSAPSYLSGLISLSFTNDLVQLETTAAAAGQTLYWDGGNSDLSWNSAPANWSTDKAGTTDPAAVPGINDDVIFTADGVAAGALATTLDADFRINSLTFESNDNTTGPVTIAAGSGNYLAIAPSAATEGIEITSGGPDATISAPLRILANQQWDVQDAGSTLTLSGGLEGEANVAIIGAGTTTLSAAADASLFNGGGTSTFTVTNGTLIDTNGDGLGAGANAASVVIGTGGVYYATAGSPDNDIELAGGTLSVGAANRTYEGDINISSASFINTRENNSAVTTDEGYNITFTGNVTGSGSITLQGESDAGSDGIVIFNTNPAAGTGADTSGFSGDLFLEQGEIRYDEFGWNGANDFQTTGNITISSDETERALVRWQRPEAERTYTMNDRDITIGDASGNARGLFLLNDADETRTGAITSTVVSFDADSVLTLGGAGGFGELQIQYGEGFFPDTTTPRSYFEFLGGIVLANDGIIELQTDNSITEFVGGVTETMVGSSLTIQGGNTRVAHLQGASSHTGGTILDSGVLRLNDKDGAGLGTLDFAGGAISASSDLTGVNAITNDIVEGTTDQIFFRGFDDNNLEITDDFAIPGARTIRADGDLVNTPLVKETVIFTGAITGSDSGNGNKLTLEGNTSGAGIIRGGYTQSGTAADAAVNGGEWTFDTNTVTIGQILLVNTSDAILNLDTANILAFNGPAATQQFRIYNGATLNVNADQNFNNLDQLRVGVDGASGPGTVNLGTNTIDLSNSVNRRLLLGQPQPGRSGIITGTGTVIAADVDLYEGSISAGLVNTAGTNAAMTKFGPGTVTLSGDNSGWQSTGDFQIVQGEVILDYTTDTNQKISNIAASDLDMRGGTLSLNGNGSTAVIEDIGATGTGNDRLLLNQGLGGYNVIDLNSNGAEIALRFGQIVRGTNNGTVRFNLPTGTQSGTNGFITDETNNGATGLLGNDVNQAYAVVDDGSGLFFATNSTNAANGNIVALASTGADDISNWVTDDHVTDTTGYTGTTDSIDLNSLRFDVGNDSQVTIADGATLGIESGGILLTENVTAGTQNITGGTIDSGGDNLIIHHYGDTTFEISSAIRGTDVVTVSGDGTTLLSGEMTTTGRLNIWGGTVRTTGNLNQLQDVSLSNGSDGIWELTADESIRRLFGGRQDSNAQMGLVDIGTHNLEIDYTGGGSTYQGRISGSGNVTISGVSNMTLTGEMSNNNNPDLEEFTGNFIVDGGKLRFDLRADARQAAGLTIRDGGYVEFDKRGGTREGNVLDDSMAVTLISADGGSSGNTISRGLYLQTDQDSNNAENLGNIILDGGINYVTIDARTANDDAFFSIDNLVRNNDATFNAKGFELGNVGANTRGTRILMNAVNEGDFEDDNEIGGSGAIGSKTISIIPWAIGEDLANISSATTTGNSFLHYDDVNGFRALAFTEYDTFAAAAGATTNVRETVSASVAAGATTINSLVVENSGAATNILGAGGGGDSLTNTSGGFLFNLTGGSSATTTLGDFGGGIAVGGAVGDVGNEYNFFVVNPNFNNDAINHTVLVTSDLTSAADITKSGRGTLDLTAVTGASVAGGGSNITTINEGTILIDDLENIGGDTGALVMAGGTLELAAGFADDLSGRGVNWLDGTTSGINDGGVDTTLAGSLGTGNGSFVKTGAGNMTLNATSTRTGDTIINEGTVTIGANNAIGSGGDLFVDNAANLDIGSNNLSIKSLVTTGSGNSTISGSGTITATEDYVFNHTGNTVTVNAALAGDVGLFLNGSNSSVRLNNDNNSFTGPILVDRGAIRFDTFGALGAPSAGNETMRFGVGGSDATLRFTGNTDQSSSRVMVMNGTTGGLVLENDGSASADLNLGVVRSDEYGTKNLTLRGTNANGAATIDSIQATIGDVNVVKNEANTWTINNDSVYSGTTSVNAGTLLIDGDNSAATGDVTVAGGATLGGTGTIGGAISVLGGDGAAAPGGTISAATSGGTAADIGTLTLNSDLSATAPANGGNNATWLVDLNNAITGTSDLIALGDISSRTIDLTNFSLALNDFGTFNLSTGFTYDIATYTDTGGALSTTFAGLGEGSQITGSGGGQYFITYGNQNGFGGDDYSIRLTAVPEPTTFLLLLPLLLAGIWMSRRRKQQLELEEAEA